MINIRHELEGISYDQSLPMMDVSLKELNITINSPSVYNGAFKIRNLGGGVLKGYISSFWSHVDFTPKEWNGNEQVILFRIDSKGYMPGTVIRKKWIVGSNGGEVVVPIQIKIIQPTLDIEENMVVETMKQFGEYAKNNWHKAKEVFISPSFRIWLDETEQQKWIPIYEHLIMDTNKERAMDNFLKVTGIKSEIHIGVKNKGTKMIVHPGDEKNMDYILEVTKNGWGMVEGTVETDASWIKLEKIKFHQEDFDKNDKAFIRYSVILSKIRTPYTKGYIYVNQENQTIMYEVVVFKKNRIEMRLSKNSFEVEDQGKLIIDNHSGEDLMIWIKPEEKWIEFEARKYLIGEKAEIPFGIHLSTWEKWKNQMNLKKTPCFKTMLKVQTQIKKQIIYKEFAITVRAFE